MMTYRAWMTGKASTTEEISLAVQNFITKFGFPPSLLEVSDKMDKSERKLPDGLQMVISAVRIPNNIMLVGGEKEEDESN